jgi:hemolysin III
MFALDMKRVHFTRKLHFSHKEEIWNASSHGAGILLGVVFGVVFLFWCFKSKDGWATAGVILYLFGMLCSYIASTLYHALPAWSVWKERLRKWDHAAIYWHIAGSYSPITLICLRDAGLWGWGLFIFVWLCALVGTVKSFVHLQSHSNLETLCFVGMGLSILVALKPMIDNLPPAAFYWIIGEGAAYITGALFYTLHRRKYMHTVFHFFVLLGSVCHIIAVWDILLKFIIHNFSNC